MAKKVYIITARHDDVVQHYGKRLDFQDNGYPRLIDENIAFPSEVVYINGQDVDSAKTYEPIDLPETCKGKDGGEIEMDLDDPENAGRFCYTPEDGFYEKKNWKPRKADEAAE